jgi:hypothetical protein
MTDNSLANQPFTTTLGSSPKVRESNPGNTAGVIPIAISSSQNAAATNPAPLISNTGTTFSTITYVSTADPLGGNQITQRIDTKVMRCSCKFKASGGVVSTDTNLLTELTQPYGPTYWDGTKYVVPARLTSASAATGVDATAVQDTDCDICCRDRNDVAGNTVLFDNYSGGDSAKYQYSGTTLGAVTSGAFVQTCRMIASTAYIQPQRTSQLLFRHPRYRVVCDGGNREFTERPADREYLHVCDGRDERGADDDGHYQLPGIRKGIPVPEFSDA